MSRTGMTSEKGGKPMSDMLLDARTAQAKPAPRPAIVSADGTPLKQALMRATRRARWRAFAFVAPLGLFILLTFAFPIGQMLWLSVYNPTFSDSMPRTTAYFAVNAALGVPDEAAFEALALDVKDAQASRELGQVGTRINYSVPGANSLFKKTARGVAKIEAGPYKDQLIAIDEEWATPAMWDSMRRASSSLTGDFYLAAVDLMRDDTGSIIHMPAEQSIYVMLFIRTLWLSAAIAAICLVLGFPVAYLLAILPMRTSNLLMVLVLLPFWTALLVRTTAWLVLLQGQGVLNNIMVALGILSDDGRIEMIYNRTGTIIAMVHILLPFMILPLFSVMKTIKPHYMRAAISMGATPALAFRKVYIPQTIPGVGAGTLLVFILAIGYYITPALVGGASGQLISNTIAFHMLSSLNWSLAAALGAILLAGVMLLYWLYDRLVGIDNMKLG